MKTSPFVAIAALIAFPLAVPPSAVAGPVTVTQSVNLQSIGPFGSGFTSATFLSGGWGVLFPFTSAAQIDSVVWSFSSTAPGFADSTTWPTTPEAATPGVELGVLDDSAVRTALVSFVPSSLTFDMGASPVESALVKALVADGGIVTSLGAFYNYPVAGSSEGTTFDGASTLTLTLSGTVPDRRLPEPGTAMLLLALAGASAMGCRRRG
jgi:hypothetical protein